MKKWIKAAGLVFLFCGMSYAGGGITPNFTYLTGVSSISTPTPLIITVSTSSIAPGASAMDNPQLPNRVITQIQNIDSSANLWCSIGSTTPVVIGSTMPIANGGYKIAAGASWIFSITDKILPTLGAGGSATTINFWCLSDGASATKAAVIQEY